jgi:hypothetical protein
LKSRLRDSKKTLGSLTTRRARLVHVQVHEPCEMRIDDVTISLAADAAVEITLKPGELEFVVPGKAT